MNIDRSVWTTMVLGPYDGDVKDCTFPILPQVKTGRVKVLPRPANLGPPDPNVDDTMSTVSWMDLTGGQGISVINPASDLSRTWFSTADTRYTDGWTNPPEITAVQPTGTWDACLPLGRIGTSIYALWIPSTGACTFYVWDTNAQTWNTTGVQVLANLPIGEESMVSFNGAFWIPVGGAGGNSYAYITETSPGVPLVTYHLGAATPTTNEPVAVSNPRVLLFGVHQQNLLAITTVEEGYAFATLTPGGNTWFWPYNTAIGDFVKIEKGLTPYQMTVFPDTQGQSKAWVSTNKGLLVYNSNDVAWVESQLWDVPPHPDFGKSAQVFRPGEAIWVASGGGDLVKLTANGVVAPASGPGGAGDGLPESRRGSVVSMATDLANLYLLLSKRVTDTSRNLTLIAGTGIGWHPLWAADDVTSTDRYTTVRVDYATKADGSTDYRAFWSTGPVMYSMPLRLEMYSSRQGREAGIDRFSATSSIELGEFNAGAIATEKLASHAAILLDDCPDGCSVSLSYQIQSDEATTWHELGTATVAHARTVLPFGLSSDGLWSEGMPFYWIKLKLTLTGLGGTTTPIVRALTLSYLPLPQDAATLTFTVPLPITTDADTDLTAEQIRDRLIGYVTSREFLQLTFQDKTYRVYCASATTSTIAPRDTLGSLALVVIQINTGDDSLRGESP